MVRYYIVRHEGSWAYKMGDSYSEAFPSRDHAIVAALTAVDEASDQGTEAGVFVQDSEGQWAEVPPAVLEAVRKGKRIDEIPGPHTSSPSPSPDDAARRQSQS